MAKAILTIVALAFVFAPNLYSQGPLTPPGAPAPTMKTLDQVEARTPISSAPFTISTSGSYYLTGNLTVATGDAITITADDVTLDLNGFTISSTHATGSGIGVLINGPRYSVTVRNGQIRGTTTFAGGVFTPGGFLFGVRNVGGSNLRASELHVRGMASYGVDFTSVLPTVVIERCSADTCFNYGLRGGVVRDSGARQCGESAIFGVNVSRCSGDSVGNIFGSAGVGATRQVESSNGSGIGGDGVSSPGGLATNCVGFSNSGFGVRAMTAVNCIGTSASGSAGIFAPGTASFCRGERPGGTAINAGIAIGCTVASGTVASALKFLGTP